jgi:hypothetical protein
VAGDAIPLAGSREPASCLGGWAGIHGIASENVTAQSNTVTVGSGAPVSDPAQALPMIRAGSETGAPSKHAPLH